MGDWYSEAREADGRTDEEVLAEIRLGRDETGRTPDWYAGYQAGMRDCDKRQSNKPALMVNFGPDFSPEEVQTAREQIESMTRAIDWGKLWQAISFTGIGRGDLDLAREEYERQS